MDTWLLWPGWVYQEFETYPIVWHNGEIHWPQKHDRLHTLANEGIVVLSNAGYTSLPGALAFKFFDM